MFSNFQTWWDLDLHLLMSTSSISDMPKKMQQQTLVFQKLKLEIFGYDQNYGRNDPQEKDDLMI